MKKYIFCVLIGIASQASAQVNVLMQHNDQGRTGWNSHETILTTGNVNKSKFGYLFHREVDDQIYAQPLVLSNLTISGGKHNVVFVATVNNSVYAFDADSVNNVIPFWQVNLNPTGGRAAKNTDIGVGYEDYSGNMGLVGTPVIDSTTNTLYVVVKSSSPSNGFQQYLHALDATTGAERPNSPKLINPQISGNGSGSLAGTISFDALKQNQRAGLLLSNGTVYITWASHGDTDPYHGWVVGYDKASLALKTMYVTTPQGYKGGIWMAGAGIAADSLGNLYVAVGNGSIGLNNDPNNLTNRSESALKLTPNGTSMTISSFFTPKNFQELEATDLDFGVTGLLLIPGTNRAIAGAKDGRIYLMNRNNMGGYNAITDNVIQTFNQNSSNAHNITSLTYFRGKQSDFVYTWSDNVPLRAIPYNRTTNQFDLLNVKSSTLQGPVGYNGAFLSVSSNGAIDSTAILWTSYAASGNANQMTRPGILRALSAADISKELWNSSMTPTDDPGNYAKFNCPTIANGKVYLATFSNKLTVYGLKKGVVTGVEKESAQPHVYPNPAKDMIRISCRDNLPLSLKIFDLGGRIIYQRENLYNNDEVNVGSFPVGIYLIQMNSQQALHREKLIIQR